MIQNKIDDLIVKFIEDRISEDEINTLKSWLVDNENRTYFNEFIELNYLINTTVKFNHESVLKELRNSIASARVIPLYKRPFFRYAVAATIAILITLPFVIKKPDVVVLEPIIVNNNIEPGTDKATLTLEDGTEVVLEKGQEYLAENLVSNGEEIIYDEKTSSIANQEIAYNYLTIPRGGQYFIKLADGTKVWLNSESQLKYPTQFVEGQSREVELIYGEAYFDVSPSTEHHGADFKVLHSKQEIQVLGTEFNVSAYKDESEIQTTLVEGKVSVNNFGAPQLLFPDQQAIVNVLDKNVVVKDVDAKSIVSWKNGIFDFKDKSLKDIMRVLIRWYDMNVVFENTGLQQKRFNGRINKHYTIEAILLTLKNASVIDTYEINNKTILLK